MIIRTGPISLKSDNLARQFIQLTRSMDNFRFDFKFVLGTVLGSFLGLILGFRRPTNFLYGARALLHGARF